MTRPMTLICRPGRTALMPRHQRLAGALDEQPRLLVDLADEVGRVGVAVHAADERGDVDVDDVAVAQHGGVGDAVADDLVDRGAQRLGEAAVAERRRVGAVVDEELVPDAVQLVGGDARARCARATSAIACAAIRPATRIRSIVLRRP